MPGHGAALAARLLARETAVLEAYRARLEDLGSPLVSDENVWAELSLQARLIIGDCAQALREGSARLREMDLPTVVDMAVRRGFLGFHPKNSVRAGMVLFDVVLAEVRALAVDTGMTREDAAEAANDVALALNQGIGARLEAGAVGYDMFLLNQVREVIDAHRRGLARDIHDRFGNSVSLAVRRLELAAHAVESAPAEAALEQVGAARAVLTDALHDLRDLITGLRSGSSDGALQAALDAYVSSVRATSPQVTVAVNGVESWAPPETLDEVFLILREALRNVFAHARATHAVVKADVAPYELRAVVEDDGEGFDLDTSPAQDTHGLASMQERAEALSGRFVVRSTPGRGTRVDLWIPLPSVN